MAGAIGRDRPGTDPLEHCQEVLDYRFQDPTYLREALTHASGADHRLVSNERLEFLGDAILGAIVCELLFLQVPRVPRRGADADQVGGRLAAHLRQDLAEAGLRGVPGPGQGDGLAGGDARRRCWPTSSRA